MEQWEKQLQEKYRDHDFSLKDLSLRDLLWMKSAASKCLIETPEKDPARAIITSFLSYLTAHGYKVIKGGTSV